MRCVAYGMPLHRKTSRGACGFERTVRMKARKLAQRSLGRRQHKHRESERKDSVAPIGIRICCSHFARFLLFFCSLVAHFLLDFPRFFFRRHFAAHFLLTFCSHFARFMVLCGFARFSLVFCSLFAHLLLDVCSTFFRRYFAAHFLIDVCSIFARSFPVRGTSEKPLVDIYSVYFLSIFRCSCFGRFLLAAVLVGVNANTMPEVFDWLER